MPEQMHFISGAKRDRRDRHDYRIKGIMATAPIPKQRFVIPDPFPSKNQFSRGSCTAQGQAHHKERQEGVKCSARFVMAKSKEIEGNKTYGGYPRNTFKVVNKVGIPREEIFPEPGPEMSWEEYIDVSKITQEAINDAAEHKSKSYWRLTNQIDEIKNTLLTYGNSVNLCMAWYREFNRPGSDGTLPTNFTDLIGGHEADIIGWDDFKERLIVKNSWSKNWGVNGNFELPYSIFQPIVWDLWTSIDLPPDMPVDHNYGFPEETGPVIIWRKTYISGKFFAFYKRLPTKRELTALLWYWPYEDVESGKSGDAWLKYPYFDAKEKGLIK
jgi:post-segregation antitoxin (ccd killing protein)